MMMTERDMFYIFGTWGLCGWDRDYAVEALPESEDPKAFFLHYSEED